MLPLMFAGLKLTESSEEKRVQSVRRYVVRTGVVVGIVLLLNILSLGAFLLLTEQFTLPFFAELLTIFLMVEGSLVSVVGAFMYLGFSEYGVARQGAINPAITGDLRQGWKERRRSQKKWGIAMMVAGMLLVFFGLLVSTGTTI